MTNPIENFKTQTVRKAIVFEVGGFKPPADPFASWFGSIKLGKQGEAWPCMNGKPMHALAQVNIAALKFRPPGLYNIDFLTVFIGPDELPCDSPNGQNWAIRTYGSLEELIPIQQPETGAKIRPFPMRPAIIEEDYPCWNDVANICPGEIEETFFECFENVSGFKLGGWPSLIQSEIFWAPWNKHPISPEYVFQIDSTTKGNWAWGDGGVGYFGRGTAEGHKNDWALAWQCS